MADRIIPLNCPACGSASHDGLRERAFGGEIKCKHCGVTSVLVIDNQWHQKKTGEYVCSTCGRIAKDGDRFCECSKRLTRFCVMCKTEFFIGKSVCPSCGWNHSVDLTDTAMQSRIALEIRELFRANQMAEATEKLGILEKNLVTSGKITSETDLVIRELLLEIRPRMRVIRGYQTHERFDLGISSIVRETKHLEKIRAWIQRIGKLEDDFESLNRDLVQAERKKQDISGTIGSATPLAVVTGFITLINSDVMPQIGVIRWQEITKSLVFALLAFAVVFVGKLLLDASKRSATSESLRARVRSVGHDLESTKKQRG